MSLDTAMNTITDLLTQEQESGPVNGVDDLLVRQTRRATLKQHCDWLGAEVQKLRQRVKDLPSLPPLDTIHWAQAVLALPNLVFLEIDTTGLSADAEIIHAYVSSGSGSMLLSTYAKPSQPLSDTLVAITGITNEELEKRGMPLANLLKHLRKTLQGKYVLSYNFAFDTGKLREATAREGVESIAMIGEDLMQPAMRYFGLSAYPKLEALCRRIGHRLPEQPHQKAFDRARGQMALLKAIASVAADKESPLVSAPTTSEEDDDHPF